MLFPTSTAVLQFLKYIYSNVSHERLIVANRNQQSFSYLWRNLQLGTVTIFQEAWTASHKSHMSVTQESQASNRTSQIFSWRWSWESQWESHFFNWHWNYNAMQNVMPSHSLSWRFHKASHIFCWILPLVYTFWVAHNLIFGTKAFGNVISS